MIKKNFFIIFIFLIICNNVFANEDFEKFKKEADNGDAYYQYILGKIYLNNYESYGIEKDIKKGVYYTRESALNGYGNAMTSMGWYHFTGEYKEYGIKRDYDKAFAYNEKGSELGWTVATYNLGLFYYSGLAGVEKDLSKAHKYWLLSAEQFIDSPGTWSGESLLEEINSYNPNPTPEMIRLRDRYIKYLITPNKLNLYRLQFLK